MLIETLGDPELPLQHPLPDNWQDQEKDAYGSGGFLMTREYFPRNFGTVIPGRLYRSAIPWTFQAEELNVAFGINHIVSLVPGNWLDEVELARHGITHHQFAALQRRALTNDKVKQIIEYIEGLQGGVLVHCLKGAIRTGKVIAAHQILVYGVSRERAIIDGIRYGLFNISTIREILDLK